MGKKSPRRGSLAYWHRGRAKRMVPRIRSWNSRGAAGLAGFAGYKAGMASVLMVDDTGSPTDGAQVVSPVTVIEVPPLYIYSIEAFAPTPVGLKKVGELTAPNAPKQLHRSITSAKKPKTLPDVFVKLSASEYRIVAACQPWKSGLGKKTPEMVEIAISGNAQEQLNYAKGVLGKEIPASEVLKAGDFIDAVAVTIGRGWQGVVKRRGVSLSTHKSTGARRHGGSIGGERQAKVFYTIPRAGQHGFHRRTDANKRVLLTGNSADSAFSKTQFLRYGTLKSAFIAVRGSVPGPAKRFICLRKSLEKNSAKVPQIIQAIQR
ncbi:50S ribosomal protein L3 [Candidatus Micrarchaeota archaeon]|nr:50S ribosomal protein L3 [Candidatus Micrarchaeota archaeon]MBI5177200.1 50S ribosomal protein L3 [Candidatus Micrarchaeota archaeon]